MDFNLKMTDIRAIIFDLDGVICSTDRYHYLAWKALADRLGIPFDEQKNKLLRGVSRKESLEIILGDRSSHFSEQEKWELAEEKNRISHRAAALRSFSKLLKKEYFHADK